MQGLLLPAAHRPLAPASREREECPYVSSSGYATRGQNGQLYIDDLYVFPGEGQHRVHHGRQLQRHRTRFQPGFHPEARYEFKVHFDGADFETLTYRVSFGEAGLRRAAGAAVARPDRRRGTPGRRGRRRSCWKAGRARRPAQAAPGSGPGASPTRSTSTCRCSPSSTRRWRRGPRPTCPGGGPRKRGTASPARHVESIVLEVSHQHPQLRPGARTGVWCATKLATDAGGWRQINRAGHPMMWPIFWPDDTDFSNPANNRHPSEDVERRRPSTSPISSPRSSRPAGPQTTREGYGQAVARELFPDVLSYVVGHARDLRLRRP